MIKHMSEQELTTLLDDIARSLVEGFDDLDTYQKYQVKNKLLPTVRATLTILGDHRARRGDDVEAWLKRKRDEYPDAVAGSRVNDMWEAVDVLLDDYRLHADTATPLTEDPQEGHHD